MGSIRSPTVSVYNNILSVVAFATGALVFTEELLFLSMGDLPWLHLITNATGDFNSNKAYNLKDNFTILSF